MASKRRCADLSELNNPKNRKAMTPDQQNMSNMCSHLQRKLLEPDGIYHALWQALQDDDTLSAVVRSRQLHIYRNGKKIIILAGKAQPKIIRDDKLSQLLATHQRTDITFNRFTETDI